ncbi:RHS repeat-associated protein [Streptacidiphilus sp. MAP12-33]|uniref:RHS repeat-associated core domain-containing protein n=1 Tax=Streptacidiphilus sp. MAP12-33 TaxID=3156266 RepID=UPI003514E34C
MREGAFLWDGTSQRKAPSRIAAVQTSITWDDAGNLTDITGGTNGDSHYVYGPDGALLLQKDPTSTTLYLPGEELTLTGTTVTGVRHYALPGGGTAVRTGSGSAYEFEFADQHGTSNLYLDSSAQVPTWREFTPYGAPRGTATTWVDNRGFINAPTDASTGLTIIGARQYDPVIGRFISLDPIFEATSSQQLNGYSYAGSNPITFSDPSGLFISGCDGNDPGCTLRVVNTPHGGVVDGQPGFDYQQAHPHNWTSWNMGVAVHHTMPTPPTGNDVLVYQRMGAKWAAQNNDYYAKLYWSNTRAQQVMNAMAAQAEAYNKRAAQEEQAQSTQHSSGGGFWGFVKSPADTVSSFAPVLDTIALATSAVPGLDLVTGGLAMTADAIATGDSLWNTYEDINGGASWGKTTADMFGAVAGVAGLGTAGVGSLGIASMLDKRAGTAIEEATRASKIAAARPRSFKAAAAATDAASRAAATSSAWGRAIGINLMATTVGDGLTLASNGGWLPSN